MTPLPRELVEGPYFRDLLDQPRALRATLEGLAGVRPPARLRDPVRLPAARIVLTGMGSSLHALNPLHLRLLGIGAASFLVESAELVRSQPALLASAAMILAVSQSGASAEIVRLLEERPASARLIAVTNTPGSPLARAAADVVLTRAGEETTVSCKTYLATLAALAWLGSGVDGGDPAATAAELEAGVEAVADYVGALRSHVSELLALVEGTNAVFLTGRGASLAAVGTGALINKEAAGVPVEGMTSAAFRHGPIEMAGPGTLVLVLEGTGAGAALNRQLVDDIRRQGGRSEWIGRAQTRAALRLAPVGEAALPLLEILPLQALSLALAMREGREAGRFTRATKVTRAE